MDREIVQSNLKEWVKRLRSGDYQQGRSMLRMDGKHCCLGVACDILVDQGRGRWVGVGKSPCTSTFEYVSLESQRHMSDRLGIPHHQTKYFGLVNNSKFFELNDRKEYNFEDIAKYIEKWYIDQ